MADEIKTLSKYRKAQKTFGKLFLISFCVFFISLLLSPLFFYQISNDKMPVLSNSSAQNTNSASSNKSANSFVPKPYPTAYKTPSANSVPQISPKQIPVSGSDSGFPFLLTALVVTGAFSFFATAFTFLGFLTMTVFAWKREKREAAGFRLESAKKAIEIEKLKVELEKSKTSPPAKIKKCTSCNRTYSDASLNFCLDDGAVLSEIYASEEFRQNPFQKTQIMESNLPTEQILAETEEIKNKNTAK